MENEAVLNALGISKDSLSKQWQKVLDDLTQIAEMLKLNPADMDLEVSVIEKLLESESLVSSYNSEVSTLQSMQRVLKDSLIILHTLNNNKSANSEANPELKKLLENIIGKKYKLQIQMIKRHTFIAMVALILFRIFLFQTRGSYSLIFLF